MQPPANEAAPYSMVEIKTSPGELIPYFKAISKVYEMMIQCIQNYLDENWI